MTQSMAEPFFIVGCGRSGTTLLRTLLNSHPAIGIPQESLFIIDYLRVGQRMDLAQLKRMLMQEPEIEEWGIHPVIEDLDGCQTIAEAIDRLHRLYLAPHGKQRWGQKTPRFVRSVGLILEHFPGSRFIHLVRDPRAVVSSLITSDVHRSNAYYAALRWAKDVGFGLAAEETYPSQVRRIRYEDLVTQVETTLVSISDFLEFEYDPRMLSVAPQSSSEYSRFYAAIHANLILQPTDRFIDKWRERLDDEETALVESLSGDFMERLGYTRTIQGSPEPLVGLFWARLSRAVGLARQATQYLRFRRRYLFHLIGRKWRLGLLRDFVRDVNY